LASKTISAALVEVRPGGMRELHWHPNTNEWQYYIEWQARMGVFAASGQARTFDFMAGDVGYVPFAMGHYIENTGSTPLRFLEVFKSNYYADVSLNQWLTLTRPELVRAHLKLDEQTLAAFQKEKFPVVPGFQCSSESQWPHLGHRSIRKQPRPCSLQVKPWSNCTGPRLQIIAIISRQARPHYG
jgi:oxalate decarboxylase